MTCIVALKHKGVVYMGADSAGVGGMSLQARKDPKIYVNGPFMFGFTSSFRMGQILGHSFIPPAREKGEDLIKFMSTKFINEVRTCLRTAGFAKMESNVETGGTFIVAYKAHLFVVYDDFQVAEMVSGFAAVGCGQDLALGSLFTTKHMWSNDPRARLKTALEAAAEFSAGVRAPFIIREHYK
jgi:ATP-dependent protease HslVU (ClpYQ) peptidase subunit